MERHAGRVEGEPEMVFCVLAEENSDDVAVNIEDREPAFYAAACDDELGELEVAEGTELLLVAVLGSGLSVNVSGEYTS